MNFFKKIIGWLWFKIKNNLGKSMLLVFLITSAFVNNTNTLKENANCLYYEVTTDKLNMRDGAGEDFNIIGSVYKKNLLCLDQITGDWGQIKNSNWVNIKYLKKRELGFIDNYLGPVLFAPLIMFGIILIALKVLEMLFRWLTRSNLDKTAPAKPKKTKKAKNKKRENITPQKKETPQITHAVQMGSSIQVFSGSNVLFIIGASELLGFTSSTVTSRSITKGTRSAKVQDSRGNVIKTFSLQDSQT